MDSRESLVALRDRVAGLKEADREVDSLVTFALLPNEWRDVGSGAGHAVMLRDGTPTHMGRVPYFTASVDAVLSLIERAAKGWNWRLCGGDDSGISYAEVYVFNKAANTEHPLADAYGHSPALALLEALLSALIVSETMALTSGGQTPAMTSSPSRTIRPTGCPFLLPRSPPMDSRESLIALRDRVARYWFDTEFIEDGRTIELISIGIVADDGREYYAISTEFKARRASQWVKDNVLVHLPPRVPGSVTSPRLLEESRAWRPRKQIAADLLAFCDPARYGAPEFWAYYADYDWVVLCQLFGRMIDLPKGWPMFCRDLKQSVTERGNPTLPKQAAGEHHALADARWTRDSHRWLNALTSGGQTHG